MKSRRRRSPARMKALKNKQYGCAICGSHEQLEGHHIYKFAVFREKKGYDDIVWLCREHHEELENIVRERENDVLRNKPELYEKAWSQFKKEKEIK